VAPIGTDASRVSLVTVVPLTLTNIAAAAPPAVSTVARINERARLPVMQPRCPFEAVSTDTR